MTPSPWSPRVSVVLPVRNGLPYLRQSLRSILEQSFTDFEVVVVDDGSTDGSGSAALELTDVRVRVLPGGGLGVGHAINVGLAAARGALIARQDADDLSERDRLAVQVAYLERHPEVAVVASRVHFIDETGRTTETAWTRTVEAQWDGARTPEAIAALMPLTCCLVHGSVMARRAVLLAHGAYDERLPVEDYDLWLRLLPVQRFVKLDARLYSYRIHTTQVTAALGSAQAEHAVAAKLRFLRRQMPGLPRPARLAVSHDGRGADAFRAAGPLEGYDISAAAEPSGWRDTDVVAVTDFSLLSAYTSTLVAHSGYRQFGNLFVKPPDSH